jgi:uncharacterized protein (DUF2384 family)
LDADQRLRFLTREVQRIVNESGEPAGFHAGNWLQKWIREPVPALGGRCPIDLLFTPEGFDPVLTVLRRKQSGGNC